MTINISQTTTTILTEGGEVVSTKQSEGYILIPAPGKVLKNTLTGELFSGKIYLYHKSKIADYIEIDKPKTESK